MKPAIPRRHECPERFCFFWIPAGGKKDASGRVYDSLDQALQEAEWVRFEEAGCGCDFGPCRRLQRIDGARDWYEPCEPELKAAGLPDDYFLDPEGGEHP